MLGCFFFCINIFKAPLFFKEGNEFTPNNILLLKLQVLWSKERGDKLTLMISIPPSQAKRLEPPPFILREELF